MKMRCVSVQHIVNKNGVFMWNVEFVSSADRLPMGHADLSFAEMVDYVVGQWYEVSAVEFREGTTDVAHPA